MVTRSLDSIIARYVGYGLVFLLALYFAYLVRGVIPLFLVAALLAYAFEPLLQLLERRGYSRLGAVGLVFLILLLLLAIVIAFAVAALGQLQSLSSKLPVYQHQIEHFVQTSRGRLDHSRLPDSMKQAISQAVSDVQKQAPDVARQKLADLVAATPGLVGSIFVMLIVLPIITAYFMIEMNPLRVRLLMLVPAAYRRDVVDVASHINDLLGRYVRGQMIVCGLFGVLCTIAFELLNLRYHMEYGLVLGLVAGFLYVVPYVGMLALTCAAALTAYLTSSSPVTCMLIAVGCCVAFNLTIDYGIAPRILGRGVGLNPLMVIFALLSGAQVAGILGMVLAVPTFASLRVVAIHLFPQLSAPIPTASAEGDVPDNLNIKQTIIREAGEAEASAGVT